jgi:chorismate dehydratase
VRVLCERALDREDARRPRAKPEFVEVAVGEDPRAAGTDAWLRIGDPALREHLAEPALPVFNPSREWTQRTGLPFVFACWIARPEVELTDAHLEAFSRARTRGARSSEALAREAAIEWSLPLDACRRYLLEECRYELGTDMSAALLRFRDEAAPLGLCDAGATPVPIRLAHVS